MPVSLGKNSDIVGGLGDDLLGQQGGASTDDQPESVTLSGGEQVSEESQGFLQVLLAQFHKEER